jgi:putative colanic acid biosynthesis UDP-glucose lipid carrier transferase
MREIHAPGLSRLENDLIAVSGTPRHAKASPESPKTIGQIAFRLGTNESIAVTALKELLGPSVAVASLIACLLAGRIKLSGECVALAAIVFLLAERLFSTPDLRASSNGRWKRHPTFPRLIFEWGCVFSATACLILAFRLTRLWDPLVLTEWFLLTPVALVATRSGTIHLSRWWAARRRLSGRHIIIGATEAGIELARRVQQGGYSGKFLGFFDFRDFERLPSLEPEQWAGNCAGVGEFVRRNGVDSIYIALPIATTPRITELFQQLRDTTASIYFVPANIFAFELVQPRCIEIHGIPALAVCETPHQGLSGFNKRLFDILFSVLALLAVSPLMLIIAVAIKLTSRGPVIFHQRRYGLHGEEILIYKFRSMTVCEDHLCVTQATRNDCRITPIGRLLRRTSLDELPQILNVLEGRMSFVGPRPHAVIHNELYRKLISGYMIRHKVRPGITGWAQVNGLRGETDTLEKMRRRVEYDIDYLNSWSLWLDIRILFRTIALVLRDEHAY